MEEENEEYVQRVDKEDESDQYPPKQREDAAVCCGEVNSGDDRIKGEE